MLRLGRFHRLAGPGIFFIIPAFDAVASWIDQRVQTSTFVAEQTLTKDTVPVDVDAVLFWVVWDAKKAALEVASYRDAIGWASQTALRDIIGTTFLADLLSNRQAIDSNLQQAIDGRTTPWGITVQSVEIRDIKIPENLQDAMSRQAQAERERQARVDFGRCRAANRGILPRGREVIRRESSRASSARHEHALRRTQGKRSDDHRAEYGGRNNGARHDHWISFAGDGARHRFTPVRRERPRRG